MLTLLENQDAYAVDISSPESQAGITASVAGAMGITISGLLGYSGDFHDVPAIDATLNDTPTQGGIGQIVLDSWYGVKAVLELSIPEIADTSLLVLVNRTEDDRWVVEKLLSTQPEFPNPEEVFNLIDRRFLAS